MTYREIIEAVRAHRKPLTPDQLSKRNEKQRRTQQKMADERARSAAKLKDLSGDLP
jgi:hypothetical protein